MLRRVLHFSLASLTRECLFLAMRNEIDASEGLLSIVSVACYLLVPFLDAVDPALTHALCELYAFHHAHMRARSMHPQRFCSWRSWEH